MPHPVLFRARPQRWDPYSLGRDTLRAWWSAADHGTSLMTDDGSGVISSWIDRINGITMTAATTARPTWGATSFNSAYPGVTGDGVANAMTATALISSLPVAATAGEIWVLLNQLSASAALYLLGYGGASGNQRLIETVSASGIKMGLGDASTVGTDTSVSFSGNRIVQGAWAGTLMTDRINGAAGNISTTITTINTGTTRFRVFARPDVSSPASFINAVVAEILVTTTLTTAQRQQMEGFLAQNYGLASLLPAAHPYKSVAP